jgi:hypothetical protein
MHGKPSQLTAARRDLSAYQNVISTFGIPALSDRFDMLRQLGNLL